MVVVDAQTFLIPNFTYNGQVDLERNQKFLRNARTHNARKENIAKHLDIRVLTRIFGLERVAALVLRYLIYLLNPSTRKSVVRFIFISVNLVPPYIHLFPNLVHSIVFPSYLSSHLNINSQGSFVADENGSNEPLRKYSQKTLVIVLPGDLTVFDIGE